MSARIEAAHMFEQVAAEFEFVVQCGVGKAELILALRGQGRTAAIEQTQALGPRGRVAKMPFLCRWVVRGS